MERKRNALRLCEHNREVFDEVCDEYDVKISDKHITVNIYDDLVDYPALFASLRGFDEGTVTELYGSTQIRILREDAGDCDV